MRGRLPLEVAVTLSAPLAIVQRLILALPDGLEQVMDDAGRTNRAIASGHKDAEVQRWVKTHGAFLERCAYLPSSSWFRYTPLTLRCNRCADARPAGPRQPHLHHVLQNAMHLESWS